MDGPGSTGAADGPGLLDPMGSVGPLGPPDRLNSTGLPDGPGRRDSSDATGS